MKIEKEGNLDEIKAELASWRGWAWGEKDKAVRRPAEENQATLRCNPCHHEAQSFQRENRGDEQQHQVVNPHGLRFQKHEQYAMLIATLFRNRGQPA